MIFGWLVGGFQLPKVRKKKKRKIHQNLVCLAMNMQS
jgi:hypothetical protein